MASIYKRGETWWIKYYLNGKTARQSLRTTNKRVATREKQALEAKLLEPQRHALQDVNPEVNSFWQKYLAWAEDHNRPKTIEIKTNFWVQLMAFTRAKRLGDITRQDIEAFKKWKKGNGAADQSVNNALKDIQAIYNDAIRQGWYTGTNPVLGIKRYKITRKLPAFHTEEELASLLDAAHERGKEIAWVVLLGGMAGMRKNEILSARWEWFKFKERVIELKSYTGFDIKDHEERAIPLHPLVCARLYPHRKKKGFVFNSSRRSKGVNRYHFDPKKSLLQALKNAGLTTRRPFQRLRESFASIRAQKGVSIFKLSKWLGHSSVKTTEKHYASLQEGYDPDIE